MSLLISLQIREQNLLSDLQFASKRDGRTVSWEALKEVRLMALDRMREGRRVACRGGARQDLGRQGRHATVVAARPDPIHSLQRHSGATYISDLRAMGSRSPSEIFRLELPHYHRHHHRENSTPGRLGVIAR
jgi:hypothetical protein